MAVIGITGSIASGKSVFRAMLAPLIGAETLDADEIAKGLLQGDPEVKQAIRSAISPAAYRPDGSADRAEIRRIIFADPGAKSRLEAIIHPRVRKHWLGAAERARAEGRHAIVDIPLLFETGAAPSFDAIITVACSPATQIRRLSQRGIDTALAQKIISTQMPVPEKTARSTHLVWNDGELEALREQAALFASSLSPTRAR